MCFIMLELGRLAVQWACVMVSMMLNCMLAKQIIIITIINFNSAEAIYNIDYIESAYK